MCAACTSGGQHRVYSGPELMSRNELVAAVKALQAQADDATRKCVIRLLARTHP